MKKSFLIPLYIIFILFCFNKASYGKNAVIISSRFPLVVYGESHNLANQILYFCQNYLTFLQTEWKIKPDKITTTKIYINQGKTRFIYEPGVLAQIFIDSNDIFAKLKIAEALTNFFIKDFLTLNMKIKHPIKIPKFVTDGLCGIYFNTKIEPEFFIIHNRIINNEYIPLKMLISIDKNLSPDMNKLFLLESIYLLEYIKSSNFGETKIHKFLFDYQKDTSQAISSLVKSMGFSEIDVFESNFIEKISRKNIIYNTLSSDSNVTDDKNISNIIEEILLFSYPDKLNRKDKSKVNINAYDLKTEDLPFISKSEIKEKMLRLQLIKELYPDNPEIDIYISAFKALAEGNFEKYFNFLNSTGKKR